MKEQLLATTYEFTAATGIKAVCGLRLVRDEERVVVVLTELPDNPGMSVTNACEEIATQVRRAFGLDPDQIRWIEHYPEREHHVHRRTLHEAATYDEIIFIWEDYQARAPTWRRLTPEEVHLLLGQGEA
jgi:hypothetical protein